MEGKKVKDQSRLALGDVWSIVDESLGWSSLPCGTGL